MFSTHAYILTCWNIPTCLIARSSIVVVMVACIHLIKDHSTAVCPELCHCAEKQSVVHRGLSRVSMFEGPGVLLRARLQLGYSLFDASLNTQHCSEFKSCSQPCRTHASTMRNCSVDPIIPGPEMDWMVSERSTRQLLPKDQKRSSLSANENRCDS